MAAPSPAQRASPLPFLFGVATATLVPDPDGYVAGLSRVAPLRYAAPLVPSKETETEPVMSK
ncbi:hypothetical protein G4Z16_06235 [Streptomyces bathyalis]|uniref:Uncharacterized protein n=1 Tax=Streptomyces bathyalis TaxID=2710756 RepID=A0A7T1T469_9ACTN|nr:hypothetical protein [Streptomyces bathyalis]QPP06060.1 hypothetical protein G4Z16_06235 [Streptomyces bathyalis]